MLVVVSPAKRLDFTPVPDLAHTWPEFQDDAVSLANTARRLSMKKLEALMSISPDLAKLNADRFREFDAELTVENSKQAAFAFAGDTYLGLEAATLDADTIAYAQDHLRILSGLYGVLRPLDRIQPYRLEMGSKLATRRGKNLYAYWKDRPTRAIARDADAVGSRILINCASQEYFGAVDVDALGMEIVTPQFLEDRPGGPKVISFSAKRARGAMARFIVENRATSVAALQDFDAGGFIYRPEMSTPMQPSFVKSAV